MNIFRKVEQKADEGIALERPEIVTVAEGSTSEIEAVLAQLSARFGGDTNVNCVVAILPVYPEMPKQDKMRKSEKRGEYLSATHYANGKAQVLPFSLGGDNPLRVSLRLFEKVAADEDEEGGDTDSTVD